MSKLELRNRIKFPGYLLTLLIILNLIFLFFPLIGRMGYENSAVNSFLVFVFAGLYTVNYLRTHNQSVGGLYSLFSDTKKILALFLFIPFVIPLIPSILLSKCPICDGILFYLALVLPSVFLGTSAGYFSAAVSKKMAYLIFVLIILLLIFESVLEFYFNPQIYFFNPLIGFTPGTIYDEDLKVNFHLIVYRLINILFAAIVLYISSKIFLQKLKVRIIAALIILIIFCAFYFVKPYLGYSTDLNRMEKKLSHSIRTEHFDINYANPSKYFSTPPLIGLLHEYYYEQLTNELKLHTNYSIKSFLFKNSDQKKELFGTDAADVSKPWLHEIFLGYDSYGQSLKHELVHTLAYNFGVTPFKVADNINTAMIEGIAVAVDNNFDGYPVDYAAKLAYEAGYKIKIENLFSGFNFFSQFPSVSYIFAGSFIKFLIDNYGIEAVKNLYGDLNFVKYTGKNIGELAEQYYSYLNKLDIEFNKNKAQLYFAGKPIFKKYCPRSAASQLNDAAELYRIKKYDEARKIYSKVYSYSDSYRSLIGMINCMIKLKRTEEAENILDEEINKFSKSRYYYQLELTLADLKLRNNKFDESSVLYDSLLAQRPHIAYVNNVLTKKSFYEIAPDTLKKFLDAETKERFNMLLNLNNKMIHYYSIPELLDLCSDTSQIRIVCNKFKEADVKDLISSYAVLLLSRASVLLYDLSAAKHFAVEALKYRGKWEYLFTLKENLRKINWLNNFSDELKPFFVYQ